MNKKNRFLENRRGPSDCRKDAGARLHINALENNYEAVRILSANVEKLENRLSEVLPKMDGAVSSLRGTSTFTVSEKDA